MTSSAPFRRFAFAFGSTFAVLYVVAVAKDLALFTVFPSLGIVLAGTHHSRDVAAPVMGVSGSCHVLVRMGGDGCTRSTDGRPCCRVVTGTFGATLLVGMGVANSCAFDDRLRLSHAALVSALTWVRLPQWGQKRLDSERAN